MKKYSLLLIYSLSLLFILTSCATTAKKQLTLKPFSSDGCSMSPNGIPEKPDAFLKCCVEHDYKYWKGGDESERSQADEELRQCVAQASNPQIGNLYWTGVRVGGGPAWKTPFHWGFGWEQARGYQKLTAAEEQTVEIRTREINWKAIYQDLQRPPDK